MKVMWHSYGLQTKKEQATWTLKHNFARICAALQWAENEFAVLRLGAKAKTTFLDLSAANSSRSLCAIDVLPRPTSALR